MAEADLFHSGKVRGWLLLKRDRTPSPARCSCLAGLWPSPQGSLSGLERSALGHGCPQEDVLVKVQSKEKIYHMQYILQYILVLV